jgi:hypothetical protein
LKSDPTIQFVQAYFTALYQLKENYKDNSILLRSLEQKATVHSNSTANSPSSGSSSNSNSSDKLNTTKLGLLSLHCGHNGWPLHDDLAAMASFIKSNGFEINKFY